MKKPIFLAILITGIFVSGFTGCQNQSTPTTTNDKAAQAVVEQKAPLTDSKAKAESFIGEWKNVDDYNQITKITKSGNGYQYEDNDGKYEATFEKGKLKVKISDGDFAEVAMNSETKNMIMTYQGSVVEFKKNN